MGLLDEIQSGTKNLPRRVMVYGVAGVGKSTFGAMAPAPIFIQTEDGLGDIDCKSFPLSSNFDNVMTAMGALYTDKHNFKTVVIDSLDWLEKLIWAEVCKKKTVDSIEEIGYAKGYKFALDYWNLFLKGLDSLRNERGMTIILLAHSQIEKFEDPESESYDRYTPQLHKLASATVREWCDEVLFANYPLVIKTTEEGFNKKRARAISTGTRELKTQSRPAHVAKNRLNMPLIIPLDWREFEQYINPKTEKGDKDNG